MISVGEAWELIRSRARPLDAIDAPLSSALGRVLRCEVRADLDSPPFDASAMDGYAARRADLARPLRLVGEAPAGTAYPGTVGRGECVRILTGAPVPRGADCVVKQEDATLDGGVLRVRRPDSRDFIRRRGENRRAGAVIVPAGVMLGPPELAALAAAGVTRPEIARPPRVAHLAAGDELVAPDRVPAGAQIRDSNSTLVASLLARHGAALVAQAHVGDELAAARAAIAAMPAHDVLLLSGGAGAGERDLARPLLAALGYEVHFDAVNLRPGKPTIFASRGPQLAIALPGNPVSHWVVFQLLVGPLLRFLQDSREAAPARLNGRLAANAALPPPDPRPTYWPCRAVVAGGTHELHPLPLASSGDASGLVGANALLPVPEPPATLAADRLVEFIPCP